MIEKEYTIQNKIGLHARPAALFVNICSRFDSRIWVSFNDGEANAKSIISLLSLGLGKGDQFTLIIEGPDEKEALQKIEEFIYENLRDEKENPHDFI